MRWLVNDKSGDDTFQSFRKRKRYCATKNLKISTFELRLQQAISILDNHDIINKYPFANSQITM